MLTVIMIMTMPMTLFPLEFMIASTIRFLVSEVKLSDAVENVKAKVQDKEGIPREHSFCAFWGLTSDGLVSCPMGFMLQKLAISTGCNWLFSLDRQLSLNDDIEQQFGGEKETAQRRGRRTLMGSESLGGPLSLYYRFILEGWRKGDQRKTVTIEQQSEKSRDQRKSETTIGQTRLSDNLMEKRRSRKIALEPLTAERKT